MFRPFWRLFLPVMLLFPALLSACSFFEKGRFHRHFRGDRPQIPCSLQGNRRTRIERAIYGCVSAIENADARRTCRNEPERGLRTRRSSSLSARPAPPLPATPPCPGVAA